MKPYYERNGITIYHGDCREILPTVGGDVLVTDPPYGVSYSPKNSNKPVVEGERYFRRGSERQSTAEDTELRDSVLALWHPRAALVFGSWRVPRPSGTLLRLVWDKGRIGLGGFGPWRPSDEELYVVGKGWVNTRNTPTVFRFPPCHHAKRTHPTEKPVDLMALCLSWCPVEWSICDPFCGTGATLVAALNLGRRAIGIEIEERYCEIAAKRLAQEVFQYE